MILVGRHIMKLGFPRLFKQDTEGSSLSTHFQTGIRFSSWSRILKLMAFGKIERQWVLYCLGFQSLTKNMRI